MSSEMPDKLNQYLLKIDPDVAVNLERVHPDAAQTPVEHRKLAFCADQAAGYRAEIDEHSICAITVDLDRQIVTKHVGAYSEFGILDREVRWLGQLERQGIAPRLHSVAVGQMALEYVGEPVRRHNLPSDWAAQAEAILDALASEGCSHNDIKCDNLTVSDGRIFLIDYGWATRIGDPIPSDWPTGIGRQHRLGIHQFDDRRAIFAALKSAARGEVDRSVLMVGV